MALPGKFQVALDKRLREESDMTKPSRQVTKEQGEGLARARLERMGFRVILSGERGISFYVLRGEHELPVRVKTIRYGSWQFTVDALMDVSISDDGVQTIHGRKQHADADLVCILVRLDKEEFYILRLGQLYDVVCTQYEKWLEGHGGRRPRKPESMHCSARPIDLAAYQDNWSLIGEAMGA